MAVLERPAPADERITLAGRELRVQRGGTGSPVVVLHHHTGNVGWMPVHEHLSDNFDVVAPDMPGYGQSERPAWAREPRDLAILLNRALEKLDLDEVTLVGFGFGGFVAAEMATMSTSRLAKLVLVGAAGIQPREGEIMDAMMMDFADYVRAGFRSPAAFEAIFGDEPDKDIRQIWDHSREMTARVTWKPYMFNRRLPFLLQEVTTPALLIWGSEDAVIPRDCALQYLEALPNARLEVIAGAGHNVEMEEPERIAALIAEHARA